MPKRGMSSCYAPLLAVFSVLVVFAVVRVAGDHGDGGATGDPNGTTTTTEDAGAAGFDVHREWDTLSEKLSLVVNGALDQVLPELTRVVPTLELSTDCLLSLFRVIGGVRKLDLNSVRMVDASSKLPSGILEGTVSDLGDFDQCLGIRFKSRFNDNEEDFRGQYCGVALRMPLPPKPEVIRKDVFIVNPDHFSNVFRDLAVKSHNFYHTFFRFGLCLPSHCSKEDVQKLISPAKYYLNMEASVLHCEVRKDHFKLNTDMLVSIVLIASFVTVVLLATALDVTSRYYGNWKCHACLNAPLAQSFAEMSFLRVTRKLLVVKTPDSEHNRNLQAVHGIRTFNVFWIVVAHTYAFAEQTTYRSGTYVLNHANDLLFQPVINSFLCVDTFFLLSGFLLTFNQCKAAARTGPVVDFVGKLLARYWRLVPVACLCMTVLFVVPEMASGPIWREKLDRAIDNCHRSWWSVLINVQNFYHYDESCQPHYWYISADMQIFPVVLATSILLGRNARMGVIVKLAVVLCSVLLVGALTYINNYPPAIILLGRDIIFSKSLLSEVYFRPYVHIGPYLVGSLVAYLYLNREKIHIHLVLECTGWLLCLAGITYINFVTVSWADGTLPSPLWASTYGALHRVAWAACIGWILYACAVGRGGILNTILSWKALVPISRLSFTIYVVHIYVIYFRLWSIRERVMPDDFQMIMSAISNFVVAVLLGFTASVVYEKPVVWIWETATRSRKTPKLLKGGQRGTTVAESLQNSTNGEIKKEAV